MEVIEGPTCKNSLIENITTDITISDVAMESVAPQVCQKTNGVVESVNTETATIEDPVVSSENANSLIEASTVGDVAKNVKCAVVSEPEDSPDEPAAAEQQDNNMSITESKVTPDSVPLCETSGQDTILEDIIESQTFTCPEADMIDLEESVTEELSISHNVSFETEVLVEENVESSEPTEVTQNDTNSILNELDGTMEFSEVLNSSEVSGNVENNNCSVKQEVFNKEELLDILQGKNDDVAPVNMNKQLETQIALRQLSRLKKENKACRMSPKNLRNKKNKETPLNKQTKKEKTTPKKLSQKLDDEKNKETNSLTQEEVPGKQVESDEKDGDSIVDVLVKDWDDEEPDGEEIKTETESVKLETAEEPQEVEPKSEDASKPTDPASEIQKKHQGDGDAANKSGDEGQPRRLGRVIKKKVIFDPDNPDTFTKGKTPTKTKEQVETPVKSKKIENAPPPRAKSKSPVGKAHWKKPTPKGNKNHKRLTEVDKLLMDEGAVNMIYQLTPEAPKGRKTMRTKAEIIKKLQSSTPEGNEMKFRERKKELKDEEAKKILGGKPRTSMSSSVKSGLGEDFETHSADDSIIYRRHSSSSYSSSCMSPRRMSDVEINTTQTVQATSEVSTTTPKTNKAQTANDVFVPVTPKTETINKEVCLNLKQKLNSKLSQALNKRKRECVKTDKPAKQLKVKEEPSKSRMLDNIGFKNLTVKFDQRLAEINITQSGINTIQVLKELELALSYVDKKSDISVTYLTSSTGTLVNPLLNLLPLLDNNIETRTNSAHELAEAIRLLLCVMKQHSKLLVSSVWGECSELSLALVALSDVAVASERATFALQAPGRAAPLSPGMSVFTSQYRALPPAILNDLLLFGRRLSASEALSAGLVSRVLWPEHCAEQARAAAKALALQPAKTIELKKRLLSLKNTNEADNTFLSSVEAERDMFVEYWTSVEGQELLRTYLAHP